MPVKVPASYQDVNTWDTTSLDVEAWDVLGGLVPMPKPLFPAAEVLGQRVRARRNELGLSQEGLAAQSDLHWTFVGQVERGRRNLSLRNLLKLAQALEIDPGELVHDLTSEDYADA
jgi:DNA-binding XRE family transcriptional regulator